MTRHAIVTRADGQPAYVNAPGFKTQAMYDLERKLRARRAELQQLASDAEVIGEPGLADGALLTWIGLTSVLWGLIALAAMVSL